MRRILLLDAAGESERTDREPPFELFLLHDLEAMMVQHLLTRRGGCPFGVGGDDHDTPRDTSPDIGHVERARGDLRQSEHLPLLGYRHFAVAMAIQDLLSSRGEGVVDHQPVRVPAIEFCQDSFDQVEHVRFLPGTISRSSYASSIFLSKCGSDDDSIRV